MLLEQYSPYSIQELSKQTLDGFVFSFSTDYGIDYFVKFEKAQHYFPEECYHAFNVYELSFINVQNIKRISDLRVKSTIHKILTNFMYETGYSIIFFCDDSDGKSDERSRLFKSWRRYFDNGKYQSHFGKIEDSEYHINVGIISLLEDSGFHHYIEHLQIL